ncbi:enoyl-CoA hydratase [Amorphus orientalis]|uniref:Enoyl-CoA hydratase domain-containing protein 3, mitochondrial n=1 Tax=Amorphus orientalis TaxID=649198 RepID=A0AAE3VQR1_9HYPH|nr:enoyl-CoA hydratase [Amorphus orientalis]MDQ0316026.1 enoyl-CoA hydratase/carnithine racemase [Amorphus orientalis]
MAMTDTAPPLDASDLVREETVGRVRRLVLIDEKRRNLLTSEMMAALDEALERAASDSDIRCVVIAAEGPAFCVGHDLKAMTAHYEDPDGGRAFFQGLFDQCSALMYGIARNPRPIIAEVHSVAAAAGCQLVAACDIAVAAESARFGTTGVTFGLFCSTPMVPLSRAVDRKDALEMLMTGDLISAGHADKIGLVNHVVPDDKLTEETMALAERIATKSPLVLQMGKEAYYAQIEKGLQDAYAHCSTVMVDNLMTRDGKEGLSAFVGKREPHWEGR